MPILEADGLVKIYGRRRVVDGVSLHVDAGEIVGLLGPNGAGKTTSFKMMCGLVTPDRGKVYLEGTDVTSWPLHERSKGGMGYLPQQSSVFVKLSVQDNLRGVMQLLRFSRKRIRERTEELLEQFKITHIRKSKAGSLSGGERRRLEIARCLVAEPRIIMLDEPFAGIDPVTVQGVQVVIRELAATGISILITDHAAREILQITDRTYVASEGRILCSGTAEEIVSHEQVKQKYLGEIGLPAGVSSAPAAVATAAVSPAQSPVPSASAARVPMRHVPANASRQANRTDGSHTQLADEADESSRPKIVFSKPRPSRNVKAPFKATDLE